MKIFNLFQWHQYKLWKTVCAVIGILYAITIIEEPYWLIRLMALLPFLFLAELLWDMWGVVSFWKNNPKPQNYNEEMMDMN